MKHVSKHHGFVHLLPAIIVGGVLLLAIAITGSSKSQTPQSLGKWIKRPIKSNSTLPSPTPQAQIDPEDTPAIQAELDKIDFAQFDLDLKALSQENY